LTSLLRRVIPFFFPSVSLYLFKPREHEMAPIPWFDHPAGMATSSISSHGLQARQFSAQSLTATIIVLAIVSTLLLGSMLFLLARIWKKAIAGKMASRSPPVPNDAGSMTGRKPSDWARKDSNVLWSGYIEEDDLKSQFAWPSKSRLFSIGSASSEYGCCPLERRVSAASELDKPQVMDKGTIKPKKLVFVGDLRSRTVYEQETTPTKKPSRPPFRHRYSNSLDEIAKRKQTPAGIESAKRKQSVPADCYRQRMEDE